MKPSIRQWLLCASMMIAVGTAGCSKQAAPVQQPAAPAPEAQAETTAPAPAAPVEDPVPVDQHLAQVSAAMKTGDYQTAATALLAAQKQQPRLTPGQAQAVYQTRQALWKQVATAAATDPKAKAAADMMRAAAAHDRD